MKVLLIGAGVIGSFYAANLANGGADVTLLARGRRLAEVREHGVVLESAFGGRRTVTLVPVTDRLGPADRYDLAIVVVRRNQIGSVLALLAADQQIPSVLFLGNNAGGEEDIIEALGRQRVLIGFVNAGGERRGHVVRYIASRRIPLRIGELDGGPTPRTRAITGLFARAGIKVRLTANMDAYLKTHAAGVAPVAGALYRCGGDVRRLARDRAVLRLYVRSYREALRGLRRTGVPVTPRSTRLMEWIPEPVLLVAWRLFLNSRLADIGLQAHGNAAPDEMKELADELRAIMDRAGLPHPASDILFADVDARFERACQPPSPAAQQA